MGVNINNLHFRHRKLNKEKRIVKRYDSNDFCSCGHLKLLHGILGCSHSRLFYVKTSSVCRCKRCYL